MKHYHCVQNHGDGLRGERVLPVDVGMPVMYEELLGYWVLAKDAKIAIDQAYHAGYRDGLKAGNADGP